jgi:hypothetical protein
MANAKYLLYSHYMALDQVQEMGLIPLGLFRVLYPLRRVRVDGRQRIATEFDEVELYLERGLLVTGFSSVAELAAFFGLELSFVQRMINFSRGGGHVTRSGWPTSGDDAHLVLTELETAQGLGLNETQSEAIAQVYGTDLYHLIQGPPGKWKTYVLAQLVGMLVADGYRVLVSGLMHRAVNNALNKIYDIDPKLPACKIEWESRPADLKVPNYENFIESGFGDLVKGYAVGATPFVARSKKRLRHVFWKKRQIHR